MANPSKAKGTHAETRVRTYFSSRGLRCERKSLAGSADEGDLRLYLPNGTEVTVEVKAGKQTANYPRSRVDEWKRQTLVEGENSGCPCLLIIVRYMRRLDSIEVWIPNSQWFAALSNYKDDVCLPSGWTMMYLGDFVRELLEQN